MFDPTAFDNMKVVIEGALYDKDLSKEIVITDRNDLLNMAKMSRRFTLAFSLPESKGNTVSAKLELESGLDNLAAELLPGSLPNHLAGCYLSLEYYLENEIGKTDYKALEAYFTEIWGANRKITQTVHYNPLDVEKKITLVITVEFERLISEDQIDDLVEMTDFIIDTLRQLQSF